MSLLKLAATKGQDMSGWHATAPLAALHGYPPFEALITPQK